MKTHGAGSRGSCAVRYGPLLWSTVLVLSCANVDVHSEADPAVDFSRYRTFVQAPPPSERPSLPNYTLALGERIRTEIAKELEGKGLRPAAAGRADLEVVFTLSGTQQERQVNAAQPETDFYVTQTYTEGVLVIVLIDPASGRRVWQGVGTANVLRAGDAEWTAVQAVKSVLAQYPPAG